ncbi:ABC transporter permease [Marinomonas fungiae]|uniref:Transport permease protein n=1 Tax=Marinomonas fungiae TaxID=1137284 RepID=A0A0K6II34_9GAMM|nr:ABC transporter permease [Marinomonas fungiae]CUB02764.1 ABC-type polysaccharide/polyol phosphate export permease [Marinomonas fungiae]
MTLTFGMKDNQFLQTHDLKPLPAYLGEFPSLAKREMVAVYVKTYHPNEYCNFAQLSSQWYLSGHFRVDWMVFMISTKWFWQYALPIQQRQLIVQLTKRQVLQRFKGSILGLAWVFITPILMLSVYTFVFKSVLKAKWPGNEDANNIEFALQIFSGLLVFNLFSEVLSRASSLVVEQPNMVKKVIFPLPVLAWVNVLTAYIFAVVSLGVLVVAAYFMRLELSIHILSLPFVFVLAFPMLLGLSWGLSALGVYLRDLAQIVTLVLTPLMFLSPIFYPSSSLPEAIQAIIWINPLVLPIEAIRDAVMIGYWPDWLALILYLLVSFIVMVLGAACFHKLKRGFADVL